MILFQRIPLVSQDFRRHCFHAFQSFLTYLTCASAKTLLPRFPRFPLVVPCGCEVCLHMEFWHFPSALISDCRLRVLRRSADTAARIFSLAVRKPDAYLVGLVTCGVLAYGIFFVLEPTFASAPTFRGWSPPLSSGSGNGAGDIPAGPTCALTFLLFPFHWIPPLGLPTSFVACLPFARFSLCSRAISEPTMSRRDGYPALSFRGLSRGAPAARPAYCIGGMYCGGAVFEHACTFAGPPR